MWIELCRNLTSGLLQGKHLMKGDKYLSKKHVMQQHRFMFLDSTSICFLPKVVSSLTGIYPSCSWVRHGTCKQWRFSKTENLPWCKFIKSLQINSYLNNNSCLIKCQRHYGLCMYNQDEPTLNRSQYVHIWETGTYKISGFFLYSYWCLDIF